MVKRRQKAPREVIGEEHWPTVAVALHTGLRRGAIRPSLGAYRLRDWRPDDPALEAGQGAAVPMNDTVREVLRTLPSRLKSPWVFPSAIGDTPRDAQNFYNRVFVPALAKARHRGLHLALLSGTRSRSERSRSFSATRARPDPSVRSPVARAPARRRAKARFWGRSATRTRHQPRRREDGGARDPAKSVTWWAK